MRKIKFIAIGLVLAQVIAIVTVNSLTNQGIDNSPITEQNTVIREITEFTDFVYKENSAHVKSTKNASIITYYYNGSSSQLERDVFTLGLEDGANCTDFNIQFDVNYSYTNETVFASFAPYFNSFYNKNMANENTSIGYAELQDAWTNKYGLFHIVGYPDDSADGLLANESSMGTNGYVQISAKRQNDYLTITFMNLTSDVVILNHTWSTEISKPLNYIDLWFRGGYQEGNATIILSNLNMQVTLVGESFSTIFTFTFGFRFLVPLTVFLIIAPIILKKLRE